MKHEIFLYGIVGDKDPEWGFNAGTVSRFLSDVTEKGGGDILVNVFSKGGDMFEGYAIYGLFKNYLGGKVTMRVIGIAASAASIFINAADEGEIEIDTAGWIMVHNAQCGVNGDHRDIDKHAQQVKALQTSMENIYAKRWNMDTKKVKKMMDEETFFNAEKAIELGVADRIVQVEEDTVEASAKELNLAASIDAPIRVPKWIHDSMQAHKGDNNQPQNNPTDMDIKAIMKNIGLTADSKPEDVLAKFQGMETEITNLKSQLETKKETVATLNNKLETTKTELKELKAESEKWTIDKMVREICAEANVSVSDEHAKALERRAKLYTSTTDADMQKDIRADMVLYAQMNGVPTGADNSLSAKAKRESVTDDDTPKSYEEKLQVKAEALMQEDKGLSFESAIQKAQSLIQAKQN